MADIFNATDDEIMQMSEEDLHKAEAEVEAQTKEEPSTEPTDNTPAESNEPSSTESEESTKTEDNKESTENVDNKEKLNNIENNTETPQEIDYKGFYDKVMAPIKANGHTIQLKNQDEVIKLIQQGANYTKKMQELAPYRKLNYMLKDNDLMDAEKLSLLIDLNKGNPEAIKKFLKDHNIDPLDIDTDSEIKYQAGSNIVSDKEVAFREAYLGLNATEEGKKLLDTFNSYDDKSKGTLVDHPELMNDLFKQKQAGLYDAITTEIDRQKTLGTLDPNLSFLEAYNIIGHQIVKQTPSTQNNQPLATQPRMPKSSYDNNARAKAAAPTRANTKSTDTTPNWLSMSDEEFEKKFGGTY